MTKSLFAAPADFIGGHLVGDLISKGHKNIRAVDIKPFDEWYQRFPEAENLQLDLQLKDACYKALKGAKVVYNLAADMGGMGFIENNRCLCMLSVLINTHLCMAAKECGVERFFYASSACVYNADKQRDPNVTALKEEDAYPGHARGRLRLGKTLQRAHVPPFPRGFRPQDPRGPLSQRLRPARHLRRRPRKGPRRHLPQSHRRQTLRQTRNRNLGRRPPDPSFMYITDCLKGTQDLLWSDIIEPINLGSNELVSINQLVDIVEDIAGIKFKRSYNLKAPKGVNGRNSDNTLIKKLMGWEPNTKLRDGMEKTYRWIYDQMVSKRKSA